MIKTVALIFVALILSGCGQPRNPCAEYNLRYTARGLCVGEDGRVFDLETLERRKQ